MKLLLDTHALLWWWTDDARLPATARALIGESTNTILVSAASAWEIATKHRLGNSKLPRWPSPGSTSLCDPMASSIFPSVKTMPFVQASIRKTIETLSTAFSRRKAISKARRY